jgi:DNA-binding LytR/AlgR family response regulator
MKTDGLPAIKLPGYTTPVLLSEIVYISGESNYTWFHLSSGKRLLTTQTLLYFALQLPGFIRIHKRFLINPDHVSNAYRTGYHTAVVVMTNQAELSIARRSIGPVMALLRQRFITPVAEVVS